MFKNSFDVFSKYKLNFVLDFLGDFCKVVSVILGDDYLCDTKAIPVKADMITVAIVTPALGPSLGTAPSGT